MSPPAKGSSERIDEYTLAVIRETAREVVEKFVEKHVTTCPVQRDVAALEADVKNLRLDMWGQPGDEVNIGVKAEVKDLKHSRQLLSRGLRAAWMVIVAVIGAVVGKIWSQ